MRPRLKGALLLFLAFALGVAAGAAGFAIYLGRAGWAGRGERFQQFLLRGLEREVNLRPEQRERVEGILRETREEFRRLREEVRPRFREIVARSRARIRASLDADQQGRFDALADEWERRAERWRGERREGRTGAEVPGSERTDR
jgi:Spy/CpxP family protein refolding chaperone